MGVSWQKLRVPLLERLALMELSERLNVSEEELLREAVRLLVQRALLRGQGTELREPKEEVRREDKAESVKN